MVVPKQNRKSEQGVLGSIVSAPSPKGVETRAEKKQKRKLPEESVAKKLKETEKGAVGLKKTEKQFEIEKKSPKKLKKQLKNLMQLQKPTPDLYRAMRLGVRKIVTYSYTVLELFPKRYRERFGLGTDITACVNRCLKLSIMIETYNPKLDREQLLRELSVELKCLEELVEVAFACYTINEKKRESWLRMLVEVDNIVVGMAMWVEKSEKAKNKIR